jgi:hypothetical protein
MTGPMIHLRNIDYRGYSLQIVHRPPQWLCTILSTSADLPSLPGEKETVRGWDQEEVASRAKSRVDDLLEHRHPN